jgi:hypothetical protein
MMAVDVMVMVVIDDEDGDGGGGGLMMTMRDDDGDSDGDDGGDGDGDDGDDGIQIPCFSSWAARAVLLLCVFCIRFLAMAMAMALSMPVSPPLCAALLPTRHESSSRNRAPLLLPVRCESRSSDPASAPIPGICSSFSSFSDLFLLRFVFLLGNFVLRTGVFPLFLYYFCSGFPSTCPKSRFEGSLRPQTV